MQSFCYASRYILYLGAYGVSKSMYLEKLKMTNNLKRREYIPKRGKNIKHKIGKNKQQGHLNKIVMAG